jgi:hypothetical protein
VSFTPADAPQLSGTSVIATVNFSGAAAEKETFTVSLASAALGLDAAISQTIEAGALPSAKTLTFILPLEDVEDLTMSVSSHNASIKKTFGIPEDPGARTDETAAFNAVQDYLNSVSAEDLVSEGKIRLGDYIDLDTLTVRRVPNQATPNPITTFIVNNAPISNWFTDTSVAYAPPYEGSEGAWLRIIVVGINSFNNRAQGNANAHPSYTGANTGGKAHLVFQFQNVPMYGNMTRTTLPAGNPGYAADLLAVTAGGWRTSTLRTYLAGSFLDGLVAAGVPEPVLFSLTRLVSNGAGAAGTQETTDKLWLPTELQMFDSGDVAEAAETRANQARLEYYQNDLLRVKHYPKNSSVTPLRFLTYHYWTSSPAKIFYGTSRFSDVSLSGGKSVSGVTVSANMGVVPAFVIRGN